MSGHSILDLILHKVFAKLFSSDTIDAVDVQKWGHPVTEGEAHFINDEVHRSYWGGKYEDSSPTSRRRAIGSAYQLAMTYRWDVGYQFGWFRRGWVVEYMGDAFCANAFQRAMFVLMSRFPFVGELIINLVASTQQRAAPTTTLQRITTVMIWIPLTFYYGYAAIGAALAGLLQNPGLAGVTDFIIGYTLIALVFLYAFTKWYARYGLWMPGWGVQSLGSAVSSSVLYLMTIVVLIRIDPTGTLSNLVGGMTLLKVGQLVWPNPLFLGMGEFVQGMVQSNGAWGVVLLSWGLSGVANQFYGMVVEERDEESEDLLDRIEKINEYWAEKTAKYASRH